MNLDIVIVDDDAVVLFLQKILVRKSSFPSNIFDFADACDALTFVRKKRVPGKPMLILLDINMPEMTGWEFLEALDPLPCKENLFVAIVTSSINSSDRVRAEKYSLVIDYIEKPLSKQNLGQLHRQLLALAKKS